MSVDTNITSSPKRFFSQILVFFSWILVSVPKFFSFWCVKPWPMDRRRWSKDTWALWDSHQGHPTPKPSTPRSFNPRSSTIQIFSLSKDLDDWIQKKNKQKILQNKYLLHQLNCVKNLNDTINYNKYKNSNLTPIVIIDMVIHLCGIGSLR